VDIVQREDGAMDGTATQRFVSTGSLPPADDVRTLLETAYRRARADASGAVADYIPALATTPPDLFGAAVVAVSGASFVIGDAHHRFSIQSVSKPFVFALVCEALGPERAAAALGSNSTGMAFDSVLAVELDRTGRTNPMVNAGAIAATSLLPGASAEERWQHLSEGLSRFAGRGLAVDDEVYASETATNDRNRGVAHLLAGYGRLACDAEEACDLYTRQCALLVDAFDLAVMGATLGDGGVNPVTGERVVGEEVVEAVLAIMATAGMYERSGEWLYRVGLPGKSGVSGGMVTVAPGKGGLGVFSPRLDSAGNSVRGRLLVEEVSHRMGLSLFASRPVGG
jgi:glutaminase